MVLFKNERLFKKIKEIQIEKVETKLKKDISNACLQLPIYKKISQILIRDKEFDKTTTNKIITI